MKKHLIILTTFIILTSCDKDGKRIGNVELNSNGDTIEVVKCYPSESIKEIIFYTDNKPESNIGLYKNGDTIKQPDVVYIKEDSTLFAFIPLHNNNNNNNSYDIYIGVDSGVTSKLILTKLHNLTDKLKQLKSSITFPLPAEFVYYGELKGVFKNNSNSVSENELIYQPFVVRIK